MLLRLLFKNIDSIFYIFTRYMFEWTNIIYDGQNKLFINIYDYNLVGVHRLQECEWVVSGPRIRFFSAVLVSISENERLGVL